MAIVHQPAPAPIVPKEPDYLRQAALRAPSIQETVQKHKEVRHFIRKMLKSGLDYDQIPGTGNKTLLQPGAEKIAVWLKVRPYFEKVETDMGSGHIEVVSRCHLLPYVVYDVVMGIIEKGAPDVDKAVAAIIRASELSNAEASCSTMETNFRFRWADARDPNGKPITPEKMEAVRKAAVNMGRWVPAIMKKGEIIAAKKGDIPRGQAVDYWLWQERVENPNIYDERNKVRQMGEKRAFVKSIKRMGALSEVFQEDPNEWPEVLDIPAEKPAEEPFKPGQVQRNQPAPETPAAKPESPKAPPPTNKPGLITIIWQAKDVARVGEDAKDLAQQLKAQFLGIKLEGKDEFLVPGPQIPPFVEYAQQLGYQIQEQPLLNSKPKHEPSEHAEDETGKIENAKAPAKGGKSYQVKFNGAWLYCFSTTIGNILLGAIGQPATLYVTRKENKPPVIEGIHWLNGVEYDEDGRTPIVVR